MLSWSTHRNIISLTPCFAGSNIVAGVLYCVAGRELLVHPKCLNLTSHILTVPPPSAASGPTTTTTTTTSAAAPTGSGTLTPGQGCKQYYTVASGDNCGVIDTKFGITLAQFIKWNPEINSQCEWCSHRSVPGSVEMLT